MPVTYYELDHAVFRLLDSKKGRLDDWQNHASEIADYVGTWGVERFWAMSLSTVLKNGKKPDPNKDKDKAPAYFSWCVARTVLCQILGSELGIRQNMPTNDFQERFRQLNFNQQVLLTELLMEIADTVQFWTMRLKDDREANTSV